MRHALRFLTFSSDLVFDGERGAPYVESDSTCALNVYGQSKAEAEQRVLEADPQALVVRTSAFFGPWDARNFVSLALAACERGEPFRAANDATVSPTYVPDLVNTCLDLLIDKERGIWHLSNGTAVTWASLAQLAADVAGADPSHVEQVPTAALGHLARRPRYSVLGSERGVLMPPLADAIERYVKLRPKCRAQEVGDGQSTKRGRQQVPVCPPL